MGGTCVVKTYHPPGHGIFHTLPFSYLAIGVIRSHGHCEEVNFETIGTAIKSTSVCVDGAESAHRWSADHLSTSADCGQRGRMLLLEANQAALGDGYIHAKPTKQYASLRLSDADLAPVSSATRDQLAPYLLRTSRLISAACHLSAIPHLILTRQDTFPRSIHQATCSIPSFTWC